MYYEDTVKLLEGWRASLTLTAEQQQVSMSWIDFQPPTYIATTRITALGAAHPEAETYSVMDDFP